MVYWGERVGSWIEEIVARYYQKLGFFVIMDYKFFIPREVSGKKVGGWSDIDVLAYNGEELHVVQCKPFLGRSKAEREVKNILSWFEIAVNHVEGDPKIGELVKHNKIVKRVVIQFPQPKKAIEMLRSQGIEVIPLKEVIKELINLIKKEVEEYRREGRGRIGKEDDVLLAFIRELILSKIIK